MPAVSICDPLAAAMRHSLDTAGQSKSSDNLNSSLAGDTLRILQTELDYEETENYRSIVQDHLKSKYHVLSLPKVENCNHDSINGKKQDNNANTEKNKEHKLPEPKKILYPASKIMLGWNNSWPIGAGMYNVGNTCYLNSTLQALFHVPALINWLLSDLHHSSKCEHNEGVSECLTCAVAKTMQYSHQKSGEAIKPYFIYNKLKLICRTMVPGRQEDAHEFLRYLLEGMEKAYLARFKSCKLDNFSKETTPINQIFGGYIRTEVKCLECRHISTTFQHFQDLLLDIRKASTLDEALAGYFSQEQLDNNDYKCEACKRRVPATKQFSLERAPKVLCIQLKRFSVMGGKISRHISFKQTVDIGPYIRRQPGETPKKLLYKLTSMVTHVGSSVNCGHYTAVAQVSAGKYYSFDDCFVRPISLNGVLNTEAYIMIFEMEPCLTNVHSQNQISEASTSKFNNYSQMNGISNKISEKNGFNKNNDNKMNKPKNHDEPPPLPPPPPPALVVIGPQLPKKITEKAAINTNGKLVDYDEDESSDDDKNKNIKISIKNNHYENKKVNGSIRTPSPPNINGNDYSLTNGHNSIKDESPDLRYKKYFNGKANENKMEYDSRARNRSRDNNYSYSSLDQKVFTKASSKWYVSKDISPPTSASKFNGWDVDHVDDFNSNNRSNNQTSTSNNSDDRNFNGNINRTETSNYLQKSSQWGYGQPVKNWSNNRSRLDKDVDMERRQNRKRYYSDEDDELDRGHQKKVKNHDYNKNRNFNFKYNKFQEYSNNKYRENSNYKYSNKNYFNHKHNNYRKRRGYHDNLKHYRR